MQAPQEVLAVFPAPHPCMSLQILGSFPCQHLPLFIAIIHLLVYLFKLTMRIWKSGFMSHLSLDLYG